MIIRAAARAIVTPFPDSEADADRNKSDARKKLFYAKHPDAGGPRVTWRRRSTDAAADRHVEQLRRDLPRSARVSPDRIDDARALLRRDLAAGDRAERILLCPAGASGDAAWWQRPCKLRWACRGCEEVHARELMWRVIARASGYAHPVAAMLSCPSHSLMDLAPTLDWTNACRTLMRNRSWFRKVCVGGVLVLEVPLTEDGRRFNAHHHGMLDVRLDGAELDAWGEFGEIEWPALAGKGAVFGIEPLRNLRELAAYGPKVWREKSWAPREMTPWLRLYLDRVLSGRRLLTSWGRR